MTSQPQNPHHELLRNLTHELLQTETSASRHSRREASRLPEGSPPALALIAVAEHADKALETVKGVCDRNDLPNGGFGAALGEAFSLVRDRIADHMLEGERSYRATLLGMRHGTDVVRMFGLVAEQGGFAEAASWSRHWLTERLPLIQHVERELVWFATHVDAARAPST